MFVCTEHTNGYVPAVSGSTEYDRVSTPGNVSVLKTSAPPASLMTTSWGIAASWLSRVSVNAVSAGALTAVVVNCTPLATNATTSASGSVDGPGVDPPPPPPVNSSVQQSGYGVAPGSGLYSVSRQPVKVLTSPVSGSRRRIEQFLVTLDERL